MIQFIVINTLKMQQIIILNHVVSKGQGSIQITPISLWIRYRAINNIPTLTHGSVRADNLLLQGLWLGTVTFDQLIAPGVL